MTKVILACDETGAKGYADQDEAYDREVGVFAGIMVPESHLSAVEADFKTIYDRYKPATGKLHIADLSATAQESLQQDVYAAIRKHGLPCFWYALHVAVPTSPSYHPTSHAGAGQGRRVGQCDTAGAL